MDNAILFLGLSDVQISLHCSDAVGWVTGRASACKKLGVGMLVVMICTSYSFSCQTEAIRRAKKELDKEDAPKKTWWDCVKNDMESLSLSQENAQTRNKWRRRIKGATG